MPTINEILGSAAAIAKGMGITFKEMMSAHHHRGLSGRAAEVPGALSRRPRAAARRKRPGEVRRLLPVRGGVPGRVHLHRGGREHRRAPHQRRRALRQGLQHRLQPLHLLRLLRGSLPHRRHHPRPRLRDRQLQHLDADLSQGTDAGSAAPGHHRSLIAAEEIAPAAAH